MKSIAKHPMLLVAFFATCSLFAATSARPSGFNNFFTALVPSATGKPGTGEYTVRDYVNDGYKNNLAFLHEVCPPLARVVDQVCQSVQKIVERCINFFVGGGAAPKAGDSTTQAPSDGGSTSEGTAEETTPSSGDGYDQSNPKFGSSDSSTSSESSGSSETTSSSESSSSESATDKPADKDTETTTAKQ